jgi:hypothetical protein
MNYTSLCRSRGYVIAAIGAILLQAGCAGSFSKPKVPSVIVVPSPGATGNYTLANYAADLASYGDGSGPDAVKVRNKMVYSIAAEIDYAFYDYETKLFLNEGQFHVAADFLQLGLAAASTASIGARGKTILGALLTGVTGLNLSIDKNFFQQKTVQAIASSMQSNRDQIKTTILKQLAQDTAAYPFAAARADLIRYFFAGTLVAGLEKLGETTATDAKAAKTDLTKQQVRSYSLAEEDCATAYSSALSAIDGTSLPKFVAFLKEMKVAISDGAKQQDVVTSVKLLGRKAEDDPAFSAQFCAALQKTGVIPGTTAKE